VSYDRLHAGRFTLAENDLVMVEQTSADTRRAQRLGDLLVVEHGSNVRWIDLLGPASSGISVGADRDTNGDLLFSSVVTENAFFNYQLNHNVKVGAPAVPHIHWRKSTDATGDVVWQIRWRLLVLNAVPTAWSGWLDATGRAGTLSADQRAMIDGFAQLDLSAAGMSSIVEIEVQRLQSDPDDDYGADAVLLDLDLHVQLDALGSTQEYVK